MTDLEMLKLCAAAMGETVKEFDGNLFFTGPLYDSVQHNSTYNPLENDKQAMALIKKFEMHVSRNPETWWCMTTSPLSDPFDGPDHTDLNRAIVECVANLWKDRAIHENLPATPQ